MIIPAEQPRGQTSLDEYGRDAESDCARAMAEVEKVLHELAHSTCRSSPNRTSPPNEASNGLDFVCHKDGMIELTKAGFRRMAQAHSAGLDTVIEVNRRYLLRFPASPAR
jgi:hypothetical protein